MKYSYNWLKKLSGTKLSAEKVAGLLTMHSFELESIEKVGSDMIIDLDVLANRAHDALSHFAMAREICVLEGRTFKDADYYHKLKMPARKSKLIKVEIKDKNLCPRYIAVAMKNIKVKDSPVWLKAAMHNLGMNSINNIVDATNYVMLETGQPLHAFDFNKLKSDKILVRRAKEGEEIDLLDKGVIKLNSEDLLITNGEKPAALAGIKGAHIAEIDEETKNIVLEAANFNPTAVRKTRMRLGLPTDAALRFEKGIDPNLAELAIKRIIQLIEEMGGKTEGIADIYPSSLKPWKIKLDLDYVTRLLGEKIKSEEIIKILKLLGLEVISNQSSAKKTIEVEVPTLRLDIKTQEDLIEEIGRVYGYENIKSQAPHALVEAAKSNEIHLFDRALKNILVGAGFCEVYNYSFYSRRDADNTQLGSMEHLELENPMNPDQALLRISLIPNILKNVRENLKNFKEFNIFEIGRVYWPKDNTLPEEKRMLVGAVVQAGKKQKTSFFEAKGAVDILLNVLGITDFYYDSCEVAPEDALSGLWHPSRSAEIKIEGQKEFIGFVGEISQLALSEFNIRERVSMFELDLAKLQKFSESEREYLPIRKYPTATRDISLIINGDASVDDVLKIIQKAGGNLVLDADLFDMFETESGGMSLAFHIIFGANDRTLANSEVDILMKKIITSLEKELKVVVRK
jgi:phenylalanyl-tRNA synthetase beta chain